MILDFYCLIGRDSLIVKLSARMNGVDKTDQLIAYRFQPKHGRYRSDVIQDRVDWLHGHMPG